LKVNPKDIESSKRENNLKRGGEKSAPILLECRLNIFFVSVVDGDGFRTERKGGPPGKQVGRRWGFSCEGGILFLK